MPPRRSEPRELSKLLTLPQVADLLEVSVHTVRRYIESGALTPTDVGAGKAVYWRVSQDEARRFLDKRTG